MSLANRQATPMAACIVGPSAVSDGQQLTVTPVGAVLPEEDGLPDHIRELWIRIFGRRVERSMRRYEESGCFGHRGEADGWRLRMEALIKGRSRDQVRSLEIKRGLI